MVDSDIILMRVEKFQFCFIAVKIYWWQGAGLVKCIMLQMSVLHQRSSTWGTHTLKGTWKHVNSTHKHVLGYAKWKENDVMINKSGPELWIATGERDISHNHSNHRGLGLVWIYSLWRLQAQQITIAKNTSALVWPLFGVPCWNSFWSGC
jgi:hypothetical protein